MEPLAQSLLWCVVQVTLVTLLAWLMCQALGRWTAPATALVPAAALAVVVVLTACAFAPWPSWWRFGPSWEVASAAVVPESSDDPSRFRLPGGTSSDELAPDIESDVPFPTLPSDADSASEATTASPWPAAESASSPADETTLAEKLTSWLPTVVTAVLAGGIVLGLLQLAAGLFSVRAYRRSSQPLRDKELAELVDCLRAELSLTRGVELRESDHLATAATVGWAQPVILLPRSWRGWTADQSRAVLAHELAHVARGDYLACVLAQLCLALHFYHPLVHWLAARLRLEQELAADAAAAELAGGRKCYLQSLAELALHTTERPLGWPAHTFLPTQGTFLRRIEMLRDSKLASLPARRAWQPLKLAAVGLLVLGAAAIAGLRGGPGASPFDGTALAQAPGAENAAAPAKSGIDLSHVPNDATMLLAIRPAEVLKAPEIRKVLEDAATSGPSLVKLFTLPGIQQITLVGSPGVEPDDWNEEAIGIVQFEQPTSFEDLAKTGIVAANAQALTAGGAADGPGRKDQAYGVLNDRTIALGKGEVLAKYLANRRKGQPAIAAGAGWEKVRAGAIVAALDMQVIRDEFRGREPGSAAGGPVAMLAPLSPLWTDSEYVLAGVIVEGKTVHLRAIATCHDAKLAEGVAETTQAAIVMARNMLRSVGENERDIPGFARFFMETAGGLLKTVKVEQQETLVVAQTKTELPEAGVAAAGQLVGAISQARQAAQRSQSMNNMKQIMLAMHNWADVHSREGAGGSRFPPPVVMGKDGKGKVPHSWRVEILPYIDQVGLYEAYQFDEPWDSEANKLVLAKMPAVFRHPQDDPKSTSSSYYVLRSETLQATKPAPGAANGESVPEGGFATAFSDKNGMRFALMFDGLSNIIAVIEAKRDIPWTKPEDILFDPKADELPKLGGFAKEGFTAAMCDGAVRFIDHKIDGKILKLLISPQGGEAVPQF